MIYACKEFPYAKAFADALEIDDRFRAWLLMQTKFAVFAKDAKLLKKEMLEKRTKNTPLYWNSHYHGQCGCDGCGGVDGRTGKPKKGRETDVFAVFESLTCQLPTKRFALHVEVKRPGDSFKDSNQSFAYGKRALCWATPGKTPATVLQHSDAATMLLFSESDRNRFSNDIQRFDSGLTFDEIRGIFPDASYCEPYTAN